MTDKKKAFLFYNNYYELIQHLSDEELGKLFRCIFKHQNNENIEQLPPALNGIYSYITSQLDIDTEKYIKKCNRLAENRKGKTIDNKTKQLKTIENKTKQMGGDSVTVTDSVIDNDNVIDKEKEKEKENWQAIFKEAVWFWNEYVKPDYCKIPMINKLTEKRKVAFKKRWNDELSKDMDCWQNFCIAMVDTPFLTGKNEKKWVANIDWALRPDMISKTLEGAYGEANGDVF